jgi:hypothetical protein
MLAWSLVSNVTIVIGVLAFGWPAGNIFLLFIVENVLTGVATLIMLTRTRSKDGMPAQFFAMHYGIFTAVHTIFTAIIAIMLGIEWSFISLGVPLVLLLGRYAVEIWSTLRATAGGRGERPVAVVPVAYGRVLTLHLAIFPGMFAAISRMGTHGVGAEDLGRHVGPLPLPQAVVVILMLIKTVADILIAAYVARAGTREAVHLSRG